MHVFHLCLVFLASGFVGGLIAFVAICCLFVKKDKQYLKDSKFYRFLLKFLTKVVLWALGVKIHVSGIENIPQEGRFLIAGNHVSNYDPIITWHILKKHKIAFVSKPSNFKIPVAGAYVHQAGFLAIDRENAMRAMRTIKRASELVVSEQMIMGIYPEGTRSKTGELLEFKEGAFLLAKRANAPIVVITTKGTNNISKDKIFKTTKVELEVIEIIDKETVKDLKLNELSAHVRESIANALQQK